MGSERLTNEPLLPPPGGGGPGLGDGRRTKPPPPINTGPNVVVVRPLDAVVT